MKNSNECSLARFKVSLRASLSIFALAIAVTPSYAATITGDPSVDSGWTLSSNLLDKDYYIIGDANFGFDLYSASFQADSTLATAIGSGWAAGDNVLAIGGKRQSTDGFTAGWGAAFTGGAVNSNLTGSARVVAKFGTTNSNSVTVSAVRPGAGNGAGSFSGGNLGIGSVLMGTPNSGGFFIGANEGTFLTFLTNQRYDGSVSSIASDFGRIIYQLGGDNLLDSYEVVLNTTLLAASYSNVPTAGARSVLTMQRGAGVVTDATISVTAVPEPTSLLLLIASAGCLGFVRKRS